MRNRKFLGLAAIALLISACAPATNQADLAAEQATATAALDGLREKYMAAENAGDAAALAALWDENGVLLPPNAPAAQGSAAIQGFYSGMFEQNTVEVSSTSDETVAAGEWAFGRGAFSLKITPKAGGDAMQDSGKYVVIIRRQADNSWKVARLIFNSDMPLPGAAAPAAAAAPGAPPAKTQ
jgi:uncharacterized protein (TIGR02246 family)